MGKPQKPKNRKTKTSLEFNEEDRISYLTGFRKRKNERRKLAHDQMEQEFKTQLAQAREKAKNSMRTSSSSYILPEVESLLPDSVIHTDTHTVSITPMDSLLHKDIDNELEAPASVLKPSEKKALNKLTLKAVSKSRVFKTKKQSTSKNGKKTAKFDKKTTSSKRKKHFHPNKSVPS
uniref:Nucleolar protein 12 n=1 Tax=Caligus clemensi TaxID=344056 RepID=C1BZZ9_CALCM|nr:Nucleolar protein 12 [Caligus clemensi]